MLASKREAALRLAGRSGSILRSPILDTKVKTTTIMLFYIIYYCRAPVIIELQLIS